MSDRIFVNTPDREIGNLASKVDSALRRLDQPALGKPTSIKMVDYAAKFGEVVLCDPTNAAFKVFLPPLMAAHIGKYLTLKVYADSSNTITIMPARPNLIDQATSLDIAGAWLSVIIMAITSNDYAIIASGRVP